MRVQRRRLTIVVVCYPVSARSGAAASLAYVLIFVILLFLLTRSEKQLRSERDFEPSAIWIALDSFFKICAAVHAQKQAILITSASRR
ncbi:hypothetical protein L596_003669 [Steinernema carpocapsae]|uniref:Uncharacterized protein n=1 Tax=Steinernema carpocapsae TaxID=34508 RepID=A0A4V6I7U3_STECR|nr:hypothetical protein L596_003669 [Steinernema carpocapsae]